MLIVAIALSLFLLAPMLDFWRAKNAWLPTWPAKEGRSMIVYVLFFILLFSFCFYFTYFLFLL